MDDKVKDESEGNIDQNSEQPMPSDRCGGDTRRELLQRAGRKALYVLPVVLVLAAAPQNAWASAPASGTCTVSGGACSVDDDCCSLSCDVGMMTCNTP